MNFSPAGLLISLIFGGIGLWMVRESKRRVNYNTMFVGAGLLVFPYFIDNLWYMGGAGIALCALAYWLW